MTAFIGRREFITLLGGTAAWPGVARAQQPAAPVIGFLRDASLANFTNVVVAFRQGLKEAGFVEGQNVAIEYRSAEGHLDRLPTLVAELIHRPVAVIVGNYNSALAAKAATTTVPIVFASGGDPVALGLIASLNRPGGNMTGVSMLSSALESKRLGLLRELVPQAAIIAVLLNPTNPDADHQRRDILAAAADIGQDLRILSASNESAIETAFAALVQQRADALLIGNDVFLTNRREQIVALAARHAVPTISSFRSFAESGGLMSYGTSITDAYRLAGVYAGRILKGEKPANLPVQQSTKFDFVINLRTAKALGLDMPDRLLALADEVIE